MRTLRDVAELLRTHETTSVELVERCLSNIEDSDGKRTFLFVDDQTALSTARTIDRLRDNAVAPSEFAGIPISVKDVFDVVGQKSTAGSRVLMDVDIAKSDSEATNRLRRAGFVVLGRTNMTEFAYSGLGVNPHFGTPANPLKSFANCIPGGSSAGAAVAVAKDYVFASLATDTGGSARIPAAFCDLVGFKPTARRVSLEGVIPLSPTLDSVGWMARSVSCIAILDNVLSGRRMPVTREEDNLKLRIGIPRNAVLNDCEPAVVQAFERARSLLSGAGARFSDVDLPEFDETASLLVNGGIVAAESYAWHRELISERRESYDPRVLKRITLGARQDAADYINMLTLRRSFIERINKRLADFDVIAMPTVAIRPPSFEAVDADYDRLNMLVLRNTMMANLFDGCAITIPAFQAEGIGFMLMAGTNQDAALLFAAGWVEAVLRGIRA